MGFWSRIKPPFWDQPPDPRTQSMNYRRLWKTTLGAGMGVSFLPLILLSLISFYQFEKQYELQRGDIVSQMELLLSNTRLQLSDFLKERQSALAYVVRENGFAQLADPAQLDRIFVNLRKSFGGFVDLGLIDQSGLHRAYVGPYALQGHNYKEEDWFKEAVLRGVHISEVFLGHRQVPHIVIAVRHDQDQGGFHILRATINTARLQDMLADISRVPTRDAFLLNQQGVLQTASQRFGGVLEKFPLDLPTPTKVITVRDAQSSEGRALLVGYAWVGDSPFILAMVKYPDMALAKWGLLRINLMLLVAVSALAIAIVLFKSATTLVSRLHDADLRKAAVLHEIEYTNKLASIGRLAAGVAHEINNPIAIINEKAGLLRDLVDRREDSDLKPKYMKSIDSILGSVKRVSAITHRLLGFARHLDIKNEDIHLDLLIQEVLGFLGKEAEYRNIDIHVAVPPDLPPIESDRGQLQQVLLNIINNAIAALPRGGDINISAAPYGTDRVALSISDDGEGIPKEHQERIFEPFFSTRGEKGTGLGLSITYGIVQKLGGQIELSSQPGEGTTFTVILPRKPPV